MPFLSGRALDLCTAEDAAAFRNETDLVFMACHDYQRTLDRCIGGASVDLCHSSRTNLPCQDERVAKDWCTYTPCVLPPRPARPG